MRKYLLLFLLSFLFAPKTYPQFVGDKNYKIVGEYIQDNGIFLDISFATSSLSFNDLNLLAKKIIEKYEDKEILRDNISIIIDIYYDFDPKGSIPKNINQRLNQTMLTSKSHYQIWIDSILEKGRERHIDIICTDAFRLAAKNKNNR